ncbi:MAG: hypothetical protein IPI49_19240 [Myxococcales bacterium]|nr:hypothetical protein [Myxococcales bacterium]
MDDVKGVWLSSSMGPTRSTTPTVFQHSSASPTFGEPKLSSGEVVDWFYPSDPDLSRSSATMV